MQIYSIQCLMNPCYQINMPKFIVVRDTESHDIFILHFQSTNNFYVLLLEPTSTFLWISIVWLNMPYKENDSNNILDREKKKRNRERMCSCLTKCPESWLITEDYMACISSLCFLSKQCSEIYINNTKTISFVSKYTSICPTRLYMQVLLPTNLSCFSSVTCL